MERETRKYAKNRLESIEKYHINKLERERNEIGLSKKEKRDLIINGEVKFKLPEDLDTFGYSYSFFDFSEYEKSDNEKIEIINNRISKVHEEARRAMDELYLGDEKVAYDLIKQFAEMTF